MKIWKRVYGVLSAVAVLVTGMTSVVCYANDTESETVQQTEAVDVPVVPEAPITPRAEAQYIVTEVPVIYGAEETTTMTTTTITTVTTPPPTEIEFSEPPKSLLYVGSSFYLNYSIGYYPYGKPTVNGFQSSDESVAVVTDDGYVTIVGAGSVVITPDITGYCTYNEIYLVISEDTPVYTPRLEDLTYEIVKDTTAGSIYYKITDCDESAPVAEIPGTIDGIPVQEIAEDAFASCRNLKSVTISDSVTSIPASAFAGCVSLENIAVDENNANYRSYDGVLYDNTGSTLLYCPRGKNTVDILANTKTIDTSAFSDCTKLTDIVLPDGITDISSNAFSGCTGLTSLVIPYGVTGIYTGTFANCTSLTEIQIPAFVSSISMNAFSGCKSLERIMVNEYNATYYSYDGALYQKTGKTLVYCPLGKTSIELWDAVVSIDSGLLSDCPMLESITISDSNLAYFTYDGVLYDKFEKTLIYCPYSRKHVVLWDGLTVLPDLAFQGYKNLESIIIPDSVTDMGGGMFYGCKSLTSVTLPSQLTNLPSAYEYDGRYRTDYGFFQDCDSLTEFVIPDGVYAIKENAFYSCDALESVVIPDSVTSIYERAFYGCNALQSVVIPNSVTSIYEWAFSYSLKDVYYCGTEKAWDSIYIASGNDYLLNATIHYNASPVVTTTTTTTTMTTTTTTTTTTSTETTTADTGVHLQVPSESELVPGNSFQMSCNVPPEDAAWYSSNTDVATVDKNGVVTIVGTGSTLIVISYDGKMDSVTLTIEAQGTTTQPINGNLYGDTNLDGRVDITDAVLLNKAAAGAVKLSDQAAANADCDANGELGTNDAIVLLKFLVHLVNALPCTD